MGTTTANMGLSVPAVNDTDYPTQIISTMSKIDLHDHSSGKGVTISAAGIGTDAVETTKIKNLAVTAAKIAADAVETAKIKDLAVTRAKIAGATPVIGADTVSSTYTTNAAYQDVAGVTVAISTTGKPVYLSLVPSSTGVGAIEIVNGVGPLTFAKYRFVRDATNLRESYLGGAAVQTVVVNPASITLLDHPTAGNYVYKLQVFVEANTSVAFAACSLNAYEMA
jgi:hypothetical protein